MNINEDFINNLINVEVVNNNLVYSTDEKQIGAWNGEPLYRKVFYLDSFTKTSETTNTGFTIDITNNFTPSNVLRTTGHFRINGSWTSIPYCSLAGHKFNINNLHNYYVDWYNGNLKITCQRGSELGSSFTASDITLIVEYIK